MSARESSSFPMSEYDFNKRAVIPSKKSNTAASKMKAPAISNLPLNAIVMAMHPEKRLSEVIALGM